MLRLEEPERLRLWSKLRRAYSSHGVQSGFDALTLDPVMAGLWIMKSVRMERRMRLAT